MPGPGRRSPTAVGERTFRARQLMRWVHQRGADEFDAMTDLAKAFRARLRESAVVQTPAVIRDHVSADGTRKSLLDVGVGDAVELVFIPDTTGHAVHVHARGLCVNCLSVPRASRGFPAT